MKFESIVEYFSFSDKHINELIDSIGTSLAKKNCVRKEEKSGLFGGKNIYITHEADVDSLLCLFIVTIS